MRSSMVCDSSELFRAWIMTTVSWATLSVALALTFTSPDQSLERLLLLVATEWCVIATGMQVFVLYMLLCPRVVRFFPGPGGGEPVPIPKTLVHPRGFLVLLNLTYSSLLLPELLELMPFSASCFLMFFRRSLMIGLFSRRNVRAAS